MKILQVAFLLLFNHLHTSLTCTTAKGAELDSAACQAKGAVAAVWCEAGPYII